MASAQWYVVPEHFFSAIAGHANEEAATASGADVVDRDRKPRLLVKVVAQVRPIDAPKVVVVPFAEVGNG